MAAGLLVYSNSCRGLFVLDEQSAIIENPNIRSLRTSLSAPPEVGLGGRPVVSLSFALNYALAPAEVREAFTPPPPGYPPAAWTLLYRNLWGYHAVNVVLHVLTALLLFGVVRRTLTSSRLHRLFGAHATPLAFIVALIWVVHPLTTSTVTYVAQRVEGLMAFFYVLVVYSAIRSAGSARRRAWYAVSIGACALGMGSKEVMVSVPLMVVLWDVLFLPGRADGTAQPLTGLVRDRWPLYAGLVATWVILAALVAAYPRSASVGLGIEGWSPWLYLQTQAGVIAHYLRLAVVPWPLVLDYEWPAAPSLLVVLPQAALLVALVALAAIGLLRRWASAFAGAAFFLILAPTSSVLPIATEVAAEHRMYLPLAAVVALAVLFAYRLMQPWLREAAPASSSVRRGAPGPRVPRVGPVAVAALVVAGAIVVFFGYLSHQRNEDYHSEERIWADTVEKRPGNARARSNLATVLSDAGRFAEAERELRAALAIRADYPEAQANLGAVLCSQGRVSEGTEHLRRAVALEPTYRDAYRNLGEALATLGENAEAVEAYRKALEHGPENAWLLNRLAWLLATAPEDDVRDGQTAVAVAEAAVRLGGVELVMSLDTVAAAYAEVGRFPDAIAAAEEAIRLARDGGRSDIIPDLMGRLDSYRAGRAVRSPGPGGGA